jgi:pimeloyl-ACP methyl ester carboxylesterase
MDADSSALRPLALLLPGLDGSGRLYYRQVPLLEPRYRVRAWAYGVGLRDYPELVRELAEATAGEPEGSIALVGESFGGTVALQFALDYPGRLRGLTLVNAFPYYRRQARIRLACRLAPLLRFRAALALKDAVAARVLALEGVAAADRRRYREIVAQVDRAGYVRRLELVRDVDLRPRLAEIRVPTFVCASGRDKIVPSRTEARLMAGRIPGARLVEFPEAGHALLLTPGFSLADYL